MNKKLDIGAAWNDGLALLRGNAEITVIIVGLFMLLPMIAFELVAPQPAMAPGVTFDEMLRMLSDWISGNWYLVIAVAVLSAIGNMALLLVVLNRSRPTVGMALQTSVALLPTVLIVGILQSLIVGVGAMLFIIPGIYLGIKFSLSSAVIAAEGKKNPVEILGRSWSLTKGNSLRILGLLMIVVIGGAVAVALIGLLISVIFMLLLPQSAATIVVSVVSNTLQMALYALVSFVIMAVYQQLSAE